MAFKLIQAAQDRWRAVNGPHLVALVRAGAMFVNGQLVERPDDSINQGRLKDLHPQVLTIAPSGSVGRFREASSARWSWSHLTTQPLEQLVVGIGTVLGSDARIGVTGGVARC